MGCSPQHTSQQYLMMGCLFVGLSWAVWVEVLTLKRVIVACGLLFVIVHICYVCICVEFRLVVRCPSLNCACLPLKGTRDCTGSAVGIAMMTSRTTTLPRTWRIRRPCLEWRRSHCPRAVSSSQPCPHTSLPPSWFKLAMPAQPQWWCKESASGGHQQ